MDVELRNQIANYVVLLQQGERAAASNIVALSQNAVFKYCVLMGNSRELAEDLTQDAFIKAFGHIHQLQNPKLFLGWIFHIAKNLSIDKKRSFHQLSQDEMQDFIPQLSSEEILNVQEILSSFETEDRHLLLLIEMQGLSYKETAQLLGKTEDAVRSKLHRIKAEFIKKMK